MIATTTDSPFFPIRPFARNESLVALTQPFSQPQEKPFSTKTLFETKRRRTEDEILVLQFNIKRERANERET